MQLLTPRGIGGLAVVRAASAAEREALIACLQTRSGERFVSEPGGAPRLCRLAWSGVVRDQVLVVDRGAQGLEVHLHGSPLLVRSLEQQLGPLATPPAGPARQLLEQALSPEQLALGLEQLALDFDACLASLGRLPAAARSQELAALRERSRVARALATPCRLVLIGRQNAGKSTLFNRLLFRERSLTGAMPGVTRDSVSELTCLAGYPYELVDTAGEGAADHAVDRHALARARAERRGALCLLVVDAGLGPGPIDRQLLGPEVLVVANKADLPAAAWPADVPCAVRLTALEEASGGEIRPTVGGLLRAHRGLPAAGPVGGVAALDDRQRADLERAAGARGRGGA
ncbi:MAG: GTPase [Planctomycetota bacterium]|nr:GTPase [Planctomycetota bacterium]